MKRIICLILFGLLFHKLYSQEPTKKEAEAAFKEIIKCYYTKDCDKIYEFFNDSITIINLAKDTLIRSDIVVKRRKICGKFDRIISKTQTFENYLEKYSIKVLSYNEYTIMPRDSFNKFLEQKSSGIDYLSHLNKFHKYYKKNDFYVIGDIPKQEDLFIHGPYFYMLRKTKSGWKILGVDD